MTSPGGPAASRVGGGGEEEIVADLSGPLAAAAGAGTGTGTGTGTVKIDGDPNRFGCDVSSCARIVEAQPGGDAVKLYAELTEMVGQTLDDVEEDLQFCCTRTVQDEARLTSPSCRATMSASSVDRPRGRTAC